MHAGMSTIETPDITFAKLFLFLRSLHMGKESVRNRKVEIGFVLEKDRPDR